MTTGANVITSSVTIGDIKPGLNVELLNNGTATQLMQHFNPRPTKMLRVTGVFAPKVANCFPMIIGQHDGQWINWKDMSFSGEFAIHWDGSGGSHSSAIRTQSDATGGFLIDNTQSTWAVGHHSPCPFEITVLGFGNAGTNDFTYIKYTLGLYKNSSGNHLEVSGIWRMRETFDPLKVNALGIKITNGGNQGPTSMTSEWI